MKKYKGKFIPFPPKKSWKWMNRGGLCAVPEKLIKSKPIQNCRFAPRGADSCMKCIYSSYNSEQRKAYYKKCFPQEKKPVKTEEELPELTATAFHCPDCPKEAEILSVMPDGGVFAFDENVQYLATLELKCKFPGQVKREHKKKEPLSELVKPSELEWIGKYKYSPSADSYYEHIMGDTVQLLGYGGVLRLIPGDVEDVGIEEYSASELIGQAIMTYTNIGVKYAVITGITEAGIIVTGTEPGGITQDFLIRCCRFLDGSLLFKVVH